MLRRTKGVNPSPPSVRADITVRQQVGLDVPTHASDLPWLAQVLIAESYGGKDEPVDTLISSCVDAGADTSLEPLRVKSTPTENTYQACLALTNLKLC